MRSLNVPIIIALLFAVALELKVSIMKKFSLRIIMKRSIVSLSFMMTRTSESSLVKAINEAGPVLYRWTVICRRRKLNR